MKPICCGDRRDAELLRAASSEGLTIDEVNPIWLRTPAAPYPAAKAEGVEIRPEVLLLHLVELRRRFDFVVVEGVGGWLVPIKEDYFVADLARQMDLPVLLVALDRLGCLNHAMLTIKSIASYGLTCAGVSLNAPHHPSESGTTTNGEVLRKISPVPVLGSLRSGMAEIPNDWQPIFARHSNSDPSPDWT